MAEDREPLLALRSAPALANGDLPGTDPREAAVVAVGEMPEIPSLPLLPARGPWSAGVGRATAFLAELHVDLQPAGWRLVPKGGIDERRRDSALREDLDGLEEALANAANAAESAVKVSAVGPWTLAAALELTGLGPALSDPGAVRDLAASLAQGLSQHVAELAKRFERQVVLQVDEPLLTNVVEGLVPSTSGLNRIAAVDSGHARDLLKQVREAVEVAGADVILRLPGAAPLIELARGSGYRAISVDAAALIPSQEDEIAALVESDGVLCLAVPIVAGAAPKDVLTSARELWRRVGLDPLRGPRNVVPMTQDGLVGESPATAVAMMRSVREAGLWLASEPEEWIR